MEKLRRWILENWSVLCMGALMTMAFTRMMYNTRGYFAVGSEWLTIPAMLVIKRVWEIYQVSQKKK